MRRILTIVVAVVLALLLKNYVVQAYKIPAGSMIPTLLVGDHIFVAKNHYRKHGMKRGDIIVFKFPKDRQVDFVKRVVGMPEETISIRNDTVFINDEPIKERYAFHEGRPENDFEPFTIPRGSVFVLGDNRDNSYDSRFWGVVPLEDVKGKVSRIYWSIDKDGDTRWERIWEEVR